MIHTDNGPRHSPAKLSVPSPKDIFRVSPQAAVSQLSSYADAAKKDTYPSYIGDNKHVGAPLVQALTTALNELGYYKENPTGNFHGHADAIKAAVKAFQAAQGFQGKHADGLAGRRTVEALVAVYSRAKGLDS